MENNNWTASQRRLISEANSEYRKFAGSEPKHNPPNDVGDSTYCGRCEEVTKRLPTRNGDLECQKCGHTQPGSSQDGERNSF